MRRHLTLALSAAVIFAAAAGASISAPASAADARAEALSLIRDVKVTLETISGRARAASADIAALSVSGGTRQRDRLSAEVENLVGEIGLLDAKLDVLTARVGSLSAPSRAASSARATSSAPRASRASSSGPLEVSCEVSSREVPGGSQVEYSSVVSGGVEPYAYSWSGSFRGNAESQMLTFVDRGTYREKVSVTDARGKVAADDCPKVTVTSNAAGALPGEYARSKAPKISVIEPAASVRWVSGKPGAVRWKFSGLASYDRLNVFLSEGGDGKTYYLASSVAQDPSGQGSYTWPSAGAIAGETVPAGTYFLRVCTTDDQVCDAAQVILSAR